MFGFCRLVERCMRRRVGMLIVCVLSVRFAAVVQHSLDVRLNLKRCGQSVVTLFTSQTCHTKDLGRRYDFIICFLYIYILRILHLWGKSGVSCFCQNVLVKSVQIVRLVAFFFPVVLQLTQTFSIM